MWYARKRGEAAEEVTGSCRKKFSNIIPKGRPIRTVEQDFVINRERFNTNTRTAGILQKIEND